MLGKTILHYKIIEEIGRGGMGIVYKAQDTKLKRYVAIKFLPHHIIAREEERKRFKIEAQAAAALNHPNISTIHAIEEFEDDVFLVMELIDGIELKTKISQEPMAFVEIFEIAIQIAIGLSEAHKKGIVHRDIKNSNIMITPDNLVKIMDFGLAKISDQKQITKDGTTLGTIAYMSPEQAKGEIIDHRSDIWSFGVVLYEMITGHLPFKGEYDHAVLYSILNNSHRSVVRLRRDTPAELESILNKTLEKDINSRYQTADEILNDLKNIKKKIEYGDPKFVLNHIPEQAKPKISQKDNLIKKQLAVGRDQELANLHSGFRSASESKGQFLCVTGEAGIGKTTLLDIFFSDLKNSDQACFIARGQSTERLAGTEGYIPILETLESLLNSPTGETIKEILKRIAPTWYVEVVTVLSEDKSDARVMTDAKAASQERKKRELAAFLIELSRIRPIILFFDDLHWADVSTIDVLSFIGSKCYSLPLLIIVAYRPAELILSKNKFEQVKLTLQARKVCFEISLELLDHTDVEYYLRQKFVKHRFPKEFGELIYNQTEGSPLFMVDLIHNLCENKSIVKTQNRWVLKQSLPNIKQELPASIRSMIQRKIDFLSEPERKLLIAASVQGQEFDSAVIANVLDMDPAEAEDHLENLTKIHSFIRIIKEFEFPNMLPTQRFSFIHILYQNTFYDSLSLTRKNSLSLSVASSLLTFYGEQDSNIASELAFLFEAGRDFANASDYFVSAAQNAVKVYATQEAIVLFQKAIVNAEKLKDKERTKRIFNASFQLGQVNLGITNLEGLINSITNFTLAEKVAEEEKNIEAQIGAICGMAYSNFAIKQIQKSRYHGYRALKLAKSVQSKIGIASAQSLLAVERMCVGDLDASEKYFDSAIPILREHASPEQIVGAVMWCGFLYAWRLNYDSQRRFNEWALEQAKKSGVVYQIVSNQFYLGTARGNQGYISEGMDFLNEGLRISELNNTFMLLSRISNTIGWLYSELQDIKTAEKLNNQSIKYSQESGEFEPEANSRINLAHDFILVGELDNAFEQLQIAQELYKKDVWFRWRYNIRTQLELANYWIKRGDLKLATSYASDSLKGAEKTLSRKYIAYAKKILGDIAVLNDQVGEGRKNYKAALNLLQKYPCPTIEWRILKSAADLEKLLKNGAAASEFKEQAKSVIQTLSNTVNDEKLRKNFLSSKAIREV